MYLLKRRHFILCWAICVISYNKVYRLLFKSIMASCQTCSEQSSITSMIYTSDPCPPGSPTCTGYCLVKLCPLCRVALAQWVLDCNEGTCAKCAAERYSAAPDNYGTLEQEAPAVRGLKGDIVLDGGELVSGGANLVQ